MTSALPKNSKTWSIKGIQVKWPGSVRIQWIIWQGKGLSYQKYQQNLGSTSLFVYSRNNWHLLLM